MKKRSTIIIKAIGNIAAVLIIFYLIRKLALNWHNIKDYNISINYFFIAASVVIGAVPVFIGAYNWQRILLIITKDNIHFFTIARIHLYSWIYRYIPGKVNSILAKVFMCKKINISRKDTLLSVVYENSFIFLSSSIVSLFLLFFLFNGINNISLYYFVFIVFILFLAVLFIFTPILGSIINFISRLLKKNNIDKTIQLPKAEALKLLFLYLGNRCILGFSFFILINAITFFSLKYLFIAIGIFAFAGLAGNLINIAPSGLGVREGAMVLFLQIFFPLEIAIVISLVSRAVNIISDLLIFSSIPIISKYEKSHIS